MTTVLKTLVDGIAKARLRRVCWKKEDAEAAVSGYRGINLTATSKTPGDAWGGVEDGDKEESSVIIRYGCDCRAYILYRHLCIAYLLLV